jgi:transposase
MKHGKKPVKKKNGLTKDKMIELEAFLKKRSGTAKELARTQAVFMYEQKTDQNLITLLTGYKRSAVLKWRKRFIENGLESLLEKKKKLRSLLKQNQIKQIISVIREETPEKYGYEASYWTTSILAHLIKEQYNVQYKTKKPLYILFKKAKFTYHKPGHQYRNRNQEAIDAWVEKYRPIINEYRKDPNTIVLTGDEMVLSTQTTFQKIWLPINEYPKIDVSNRRQNRSVYGFLNVDNGVQLAYKTMYQNSTNTCSVLDQLCQYYKDKKIVLVWDNASWHRSEAVRKWLSETKHNIFLIALPTYAPELNPQEHVWKEGRSKVSHNKFIENIDKATDEFVDYLNKTLFRYSFLN